jgi:hypothetical protein
LHFAVIITIDRRNVDSRCQASFIPGSSNNWRIYFHGLWLVVIVAALGFVFPWSSGPSLTSPQLMHGHVRFRNFSTTVIASHQAGSSIRFFHDVHKNEAITVICRRLVVNCKVLLRVGGSKIKKYMNRLSLYHSKNASTVCFSHESNGLMGMNDNLTACKR